MKIRKIVGLIVICVLLRVLLLVAVEASGKAERSVHRSAEAGRRYEDGAGEATRLDFRKPYSRMMLGFISQQALWAEPIMRSP